MNANFAFPGITEPGLPNLTLAALLATLAGISFVLDFLPPDPGNLPSIPSISLFFAPFIASMALKFDLPPTIDPLKVEIEAPTGLFPGIGLINIALTCVFTVFGLFIGIIKSIIDLSPKLPTIELFIELFVSTGLGFGLPKLPLIKLGGCLGVAVIGLMTALIPI